MNDEPVNEAGVDVSLARVSQDIKSNVWDLGNGTYNVAFSHVPQDAKRLEVTARVPDPRHSGEMISQTLIVDISKGDNVDIPVNISEN